MSRIKTLILYVFVAGTIFGADLYSKAAIFEHLGCVIVHDAEGRPQLAEHGLEKPIIEGWFHLEASINHGAFSGWFSKHTGMLAVVSILAVVFITALALAPSNAVWLMGLALGLLAGGALGNFYDRVTLAGVRDFLKVFRGDWVWPNFNIADSAICVGVGLIFLREIFGWGRIADSVDTTPSAQAAESSSAAASPVDADAATDAPAATAKE